MINRQWWVEKWLELLDSYRFKKRLERARNYAREGNVLNIEFKQNHLISEVQGSESQPYRVTLSLEAFSDEDWGYVIETMSEKALLAAQLLVGEMPSEIEQVFIKNGLSLFPFNLTDVKSRCTCPDKANPCKHIGAVYYQLADRFSEDPFIIFQLRGRSKEQILEALRVCRGIKLSGKTPQPEMLGKIKSLPKRKAKANKTSVPLSIDSFWEYDEPLDSSLVVITPPTDNKNILDVLGDIPLPYNDAQALMQYLQQVYNILPVKVMEIALTDNG
ncbi:SWIM zinc finger family protein [Cyanobacterium stanieri LEGE 03274]|uniref:SWIM zinc finger family protein n=1 Tax=Cyanobacterium stanieri LEGE 03274 TaxID=1828756 RepID=A0ABR9V5R4_9CHRO|nr:SWIM zinc finger family protein [Cyanobacterium stanieri]MBE9222879.1 SWIM zinc finger family protein [Cyanobacterium stanieri LEGE 03274]